jgi:hypothetical protein
LRDRAAQGFDDLVDAFAILKAAGAPFLLSAAGRPDATPQFREATAPRRLQRGAPDRGARGLKKKIKFSMSNGPGCLAPVSRLPARRAPANRGNGAGEKI